MIDAILADSAQRPELFHWRGQIPTSKIESWERENRLTVPPDLKLLWSTTGGGDLFESETILQPFGSSEDTLVLPVSETCWERGLADDNYIFHEGFRVSCFRKSGALLITRNLSDLTYIAEFQDLNSWYRATLKAEYEQRYRLAP